MKTDTNKTNEAAIIQVMEAYYFKGIYTGNVELLGRAFHKDTLLFGDIKGQPYAKTLEQYLNGVANRVSPKDSAKPFDCGIISIDVINTIAMVKARVKMYEFNYYDLLSFHKLDNRWAIVNKMLTHVDL